MVERTSTELSQSGSFGLLTDSGDGEPTLSVVIERNKLPDSPQLSVFNPLHWKPLITSYLASNHPAIATVYTIIAAFSAYFSIYGISSSLFVATFDGVKVFGGLDLKVAFSISQMLGYAVSKVAGAIIIPTIKRHQRCPTLILLAVLAEAPLVIFGFTPAISQVIMVFLSGIPMAWMWGIMVMYLEGRKTSEFLLMGLYLSVMVASGAAKSIAAAVLKAGIAESWMPALCGAFSALAFILFILMLDAVPDPNVEDKKVRSERRTMSQAEARRFLVRWAPGLILVTLVYALLGAYRNFRDYFSPELWRDLEGPDFDPSRFTQSELPVGICTAVAYSTLYFIKDNKKAFFGILGVMFTGGAVILIATFAQTFDWVNPLEWMIMVGVGLFMAFIPPGAMLYDRFNGATGHPYTSVFMIYLSDVCGYCFTLAVLFYRNFGDANISYVKFFHSLSFIVSIVCMGGMTAAGVYFYFAMRNLQPLAPSHSGEEVGQVQKGGVVPTEEVELEETKKPVEEEIYVEEKKHEDDEEHEKPKEEEESEEVLAQSPLI